VASWLLKRPLIIHEQNAKAGLTNKLLGRFASKILEGFPDSFPRQPKVMTIGNPVRAEIENLSPPRERFHGKGNPLRLLVLGGSLGAQALNEVVPNMLARLSADQRPEVWHQTGEKNFEPTKKRYTTLGLSVNLVPFIKDMAEAYGWADLVICRAGALTIAELCAAGLGAVVVPYPFAVDDHQTANAYFMVNNQAAMCIQQKELTDDRLADIILQLTQLPEKRLAMAQAAYELRQVKVVEKIFAICKEICP